MTIIEATYLEHTSTPIATGLRAGLRPVNASVRRLTICHPIWRLECGGLEKQMLSILRALPEDEFSHIIAIQDGPADDRHVHLRLPNTVCRGHTSSGSDRHWSATLADILRRGGADVLHVRGLSLLIDALMAADFAGRVRVAFSFHGFESWPPKLSALRRRILRAAVRRCDDRWAVGPSAARAIAKVLNMSADEFAVVPNGVDTRHFSPAVDRAAVRLQLGLPEDRPVILTVGNLKPIKGHDVLLYANAKLSTTSPLSAFVLVGHDDSAGRLPLLAKKLGIADRCIFAGPQADILPWYQAADVFVLPSSWEGMSNALLEAMSCGLPVVATAVGGNVDLVQDDVTGLLIPPGDPQQLAVAIDRLMREAVTRERLGSAARHHVVQHHDLNTCAETHARRYHAIASPSRKDAP